MPLVFHKLEFSHYVRQIRKVIIHIKQEVGKKFPGYEHVAMGSFLFLRYFIPAIAVPSQFGLLQRYFIYIFLFTLNQKILDHTLPENSC